MKLLRKAAKYYSKQNNRIVYVISYRFMLAGYYDGTDKVRYAYNNGKRISWGGDPALPNNFDAILSTYY